MKTSATNYLVLLDNKTQPKARPGSNPRHTACRLIEIAHHLRRAVRALQTLAPSKESELLTLLRVRRRVEGIARLVSETTKDLKLIGVSKNDPVIEINGKRLGLQKLSRRLRRARVQLDNEYAAMTTKGLHGQAVGGSGQDKPGQEGDAEPKETATQTGANVAEIIGAVIGLGALLEWLFNQEDDDNARKRIAEASHKAIRDMDENELVSLINAMIDGPTGDDDEEAILKILEAHEEDCIRLGSIVNRIGVDVLLDNIDGAEWDRLVSLLAKCDKIRFDQMDDDASRLFVNKYEDQVGGLDIGNVRQLVLNMFSGSCGDDDEDAILKLLRHQSGNKLHQLVAMPGTDESDFDYNFDGDQWDELEYLFAVHGIDLDA